MFSPDNDVKLSFICVNYLTSAISSVCYAISCIVIYSMYYDTNCTSTVFLSLQQWVLGCGIAYCIIPFLYLTIFGIRHKIGAFLYYFYIYMLYLLFNIIWNIIGGIILFRDSSYCLERASPLWVVSISGLIYQWITIFSVLWEIKCKYDKIKY